MNTPPASGRGVGAYESTSMSRTREWRVVGLGAPSRGARAAFAVALYASLLVWTAPVGAQVLLLPLERDGQVAETSDIAEAAVAAGTRLLAEDDVSQAILAGYGEDPPAVSESDLARWIASSRQAVRSLARADYEGARGALAQAEAVSDRALAELNREAARARQVLDTCLYLVRSLEETDQHARAVEQGHACRRLVPRGEPTPTQHPPEVRAILEEVDRELARSPGARLRVVSEPTGCAVRLNGIDFGTTPLFTEDLRAGEYRVQVECGEQRGRVHRVELGPSGVELRVDAVVESLLATRPLRLVARGVDSALVARLARLGRIAGATEVWVVEEEGRARSRTWTLRRIVVGNGREVAVVRTGRSSLPLAIGSMRQGRSHDWTNDRGIEASSPVSSPERVLEDAVGQRSLSPEPTTVAEQPTAARASEGEEPSSRSSSHDSTAEHVGSVLLAGAGLAAYAGAYVAWEVRRSHYGYYLAVAEPTDVDYLARQARWLDWRIPVWSLSAAGAVLWTLAVPLGLGPERDVPWWSWTLGIVGLVGIGVGAGVALEASACPTHVEIDQRCVEADAQQDLGWIIATQAAPLLSFPITHLVRGGGGGAEASVAVSARGDGLLVSWGSAL